MSVLYVRDLAKTYGSRRSPVHALRGVSFYLEGGEIVALLGPNGAGKSTLLKLLLGLVHPSAGEARIFSIPISEAGARRDVGYVPETLDLPEAKGGADLLRTLGSLHGCHGDVLEARIRRLLETTGLQGVRQPVRAYSKGMRRRLSLAQALLHEPKLLFLDEPTDGLDPTERQRVLTMLQEHRSVGGTVLLCSHLLSEVEAVSDRYLILDKGRIRKEGTAADLDVTGYRVCLPEELPVAIRPTLPPVAVLDADARSVLVTDTSALSTVLQWLGERQVVSGDVVPLRPSLADFFPQQEKTETTYE